MKILNVSCNNCGAPLEVPHKTRFLTCTFCESRLEVQRTDSAYYTNVLEVVQQAVHEVKDDMETIKLQNDLERIDREWNMEREKWLTTDKHGGRHAPSAGVAIAIMIGAIAGGVFIMANAPDQMRLFGIAFMGFGALGGAFMISRARQYESRKQRYLTRRRQVARALRGR